MEPCFKLSKRAVYLSNESISAFTSEQQVEISFFLGGDQNDLFTDTRNIMI